MYMYHIFKIIEFVWMEKQLGDLIQHLYFMDEENETHSLEAEMCI